MSDFSYLAHSETDTLTHTHSLVELEHCSILLSIYAYDLGQRDQEQKHYSKTVAQEHDFPLHSNNTHKQTNDGDDWSKNRHEWLSLSEKGFRVLTFLF